MRVFAITIAAALTLSGAASAQTVVSTGSGLAHECFIHAKAGTKPREGVRLCDLAFRQDRLNTHDKAATYDNRGVLLNMINEVDRAEADFKSAISLDPSLGDPHVNLGSMLIRKKQFREAIAQIDKGMALGMSFPQIRGFSAVYSSDMIRAQETARILCGQEPPLAET